jgi:membrane protein DedA with SNARE-associated domain
VIRTFIAFPAGVARMDLKKFVIYTFAGSLPWCIGLAYVGQKLGKEWDTNPTLKTLFHRFDFVIGILIVLAAVWWIRRHIKHVRSDSRKNHV